MSDKYNPWENSSNSGDNNYSNLSGFFKNYNFGPQVPQKQYLYLLIAICFFVWILGGIYQVKEGEEGAVFRFGKLNRTSEPGINYHLPSPFETVSIVDTSKSRITEIGFPRDQYNQQTIVQKGLMLTGDANIVSLHCRVMWHIQDLPEFLLKVKDQEDTIMLVAESAIREIIGQTDIASILSNKKYEASTKIKTLVQNILDQYDIGVQIEHVQLLRVEPPLSVINAYRDVQTAKADKERFVNEALAYRNSLLPKNRGEAEKIIQEAIAYRYNVIKSAEARVSRYIAIYNAYKQNNIVTKNRMYYDMIDNVLKNSEKVITHTMVPHMQIK